MCAAKFPLQLLGLCIVTVLAVSFYNAHYSFAATYNKGKAVNQNTTVAMAESQQPLVTTQSMKVEKQSPDELEATLIKSEEVLQQQVARAEALLAEKKQQTARLEQKVESAKNLLNSSDQNSQHAFPDLQLYNADWLQAVPENHYVVQIAAATEPKVLMNYASDKRFNPPLAIYPFKLNRKGELMYGLSTGLFIVQDDALTELPILSEISEEHGVWVRKVADIKLELAALQQNRTIQ